MLCAEFVYIWCSLRLLVCVEPLVVEQEISIAAASETGVQHKLLSVKQSWKSQVWWMLLKKFPHKNKIA